jgi:hypothetical protein
MKFLFIILCFLILPSYGQKKVGKSYYSYPSRTIEVQINDTCIFWRVCHQHIGIDKGTIYHYDKKNDTLYIIKTDFSGNKYKQAIIKKDKYLDYVYNENCGMLFKRDGIFFRLKTWYVYRTTRHENKNLVLELYSRIKRLKVFNKICDMPQVRAEFYELQ